MSAFSDTLSQYISDKMSKFIPWQSTAIRTALACTNLSVESVILRLMKS